MRDAGIVDINAVIGTWPLDDAEPLTAATLIAQMDRLGIEAASVRHADAIVYDPEIGNLRLIEQIRDFPRLRPAFVVGPLDCMEHVGPSGLVDLLDRNGVEAVWIYPLSHGWKLRDTESVTLMRQLALAGRPVLVNLNECNWEDVAFLATALPKVPIVVCSIGYRSLRQAYAVMQRHDNIMVDTSYLAANDGLEIITARFGDRRVVFGTGTPRYDAGGAIFRLARSGLKRSTRSAVAATTAGRVGIASSRRADRLVREPLAELRGVVDAHAHIGRWPSSWVPGPGADTLIKSMDRCSTEIAIISSMDALWTGEVRVGNAAACLAAESYPGRIYVHAVANPHFERDRPYLESLLKRSDVRGIKVHPHTHGCAIDDPRYEWIWELATEYNVPVLGHSFHGTWHSDPVLFGKVALRHPNLTLIVGHSGALPGGFLSTIEAGKRSENMVAEICGSAMTGWWLRRLVDALGPKRVLYGTDATLIDPRYSLGRVAYAPLNETERQLVLSGNARRLYQLNEPIKEKESYASSSSAVRQ